VSDSKHVACLLLSIDQIYPPAFQLALDMLKVFRVCFRMFVLVLFFNRFDCSV
jgi:hypothetical protein